MVGGGHGGCGVVRVEGKEGEGERGCVCGTLEEMGPSDESKIGGGGGFFSLLPPSTLLSVQGEGVSISRYGSAVLSIAWRVILLGGSGGGGRDGGGGGLRAGHAPAGSIGDERWVVTVLHVRACGYLQSLPCMHACTATIAINRW